MVRLGAAYHGIKYQLYLQWLIEEGIKSEAKYYGWSVLSTPYKIQGPTEVQRIKILRLMQTAKRIVKKSKLADETQTKKDT